MNRNHWGFILLTAILVVAVTPAANAAVLGTLEVNAGYSKDANSGSYVSDGTLGGGVAFGAGYYRSLAPMLNWGIEVGMDNLGSSDFNDPLFGSGQVSAKAFRINPALRINLGAPVGPSIFMQVAGGLYNVKGEVKFDSGGSMNGSDTKFGANVGAGVGFPIAPKTRMSLLGQYHTVATDGTSTNYFAVKAGLGFSI
jgi:outer membrane protein with beta-barrel domain